MPLSDVNVTNLQTAVAQTKFMTLDWLPNELRGDQSPYPKPNKYNKSCALEQTILSYQGRYRGQRKSAPFLKTSTVRATVLAKGPKHLRTQ